MDWYKAYGEIRRSNQLFNGEEMQDNHQDIFSDLHHIQRGYEDSRLHSHMSEKHIKWITPAAIDEHFGWEWGRRWSTWRLLRKIDWRLMKTNHLRRTPLKSNQVEVKISKERNSWVKAIWLKMEMTEAKWIKTEEASGDPWI